MNYVHGLDIEPFTRIPKKHIYFGHALSIKQRKLVFQMGLPSFNDSMKL